MNGKEVDFSALLSLIPEGVFAELGERFAIDYEVKKLTGRRMFLLLLFAFMQFDQVSQRTLQVVFELPEYRVLAGVGAECGSARHNSLGCRLRRMDPRYLASIHRLLFQRLARTERRRTERLFGGHAVHELVAVDSTLVTNGARCLESHIRMAKNSAARDRRPKKGVKYTFAMSSTGLLDAAIHTDQASLSENEALHRMVSAYAASDPEGGCVYLIDRGLNSAARFAGLAREGVGFVCRVNANRKYLAVRDSGVPRATAADMDPALAGLHAGDAVESDQVVRLRSPRGGYGSDEFRLVRVTTSAPVMARKGHRDRADRQLWLLTDDMATPAEVLVAYYGMRWRIECLFRFLKQRLSLNRFISGSRRGLENVMHVMLISAMLLLLYARLNGVGYTQARRQFRLQISWLIVGADQSLAQALQRTSRPPDPASLPLLPRAIKCHSPF